MSHLFDSEAAYPDHMDVSRFIPLHFSTELDWAVEGDRFLRLILERRGEEYSGRLSFAVVPSHTVNEPDFDGVAISASLNNEEGDQIGPPLPSLYILRTNGANYRPTVLRQTSIPDLHAQARKWQEAIDQAVVDLQSVRSAFTWHAVIAARDQRGVFQKLRSASYALGMSLAPATRPFIRTGTDLVPPISLAGPQQGTYPITVSGRDEGETFEDIIPKAQRRLSRLCGLLSLHWDACWDVAIPPTPEELDAESAQGDEHLEQERDEPWGCDVVDLPTWLEAAATRCDDVPHLNNLVTTHHQAINLEVHFPSFALIAYVAVAETIGAELEDLHQCKCCGTRTGAMRRFKAALAQALDPEQARELARAYRKRSKTAHEGALFAAEWLAEEPAPKIFDRAAPGWFRTSDLEPMRKVSRTLLLARIGDRDTGDE